MTSSWCRSVLWMCFRLGVFFSLPCFAPLYLQAGRQLRDKLNEHDKIEALAESLLEAMDLEENVSDSWLDGLEFDEDFFEGAVECTDVACSTGECL